MTDTSTQQRVRGIGAKALAALRPLIPKRFRRDRPVVPVVRLTGVIGFSTPLRPGLSLAAVARTLDRAFAMRNAPAVALAINSPGGSPVQSHLIFRRIRELAAGERPPRHRLRRRRRRLGRLHDRLRGRRDHRRSAFDRRLDRRRRRLVRLRQADREVSASSAGSIRRASTRRCSIRSCRKIPDDVERLKKLQREIHDDFIALVKSRRGGKLNGPENDLFSGEYWTGRRGAGARPRRRHRRFAQRAARTIWR